ncbi:hypothetical protein PoB_000766100 [Plakobranchus ocellatus]|uniref:Uncharacterized protein n=1 Tax=Plakobranchus ocellatus TaxID=259542 RepID=A0AAV3Y1P2_9GAST|nr:hypothetical protein PoB_000766100 [Plakobranchus ocellatus]
MLATQLGDVQSTASSKDVERPSNRFGFAAVFGKDEEVQSSGRDRLAQSKGLRLAVALEAEGVGGTVAGEAGLRSAGTLLSRVRAPPPAPWLDRGPESLRSPCCGLAIYKNQTFRTSETFFFKPYF